MTSDILRTPSARPAQEPATFLMSLARLFNDGVMGFLALVALATALGPMVFDVSVEAERALTVVEWVLVTTFAAEFIIQGAVAQDRRAWLWNRWRIVDVVTILGPVVALLPQVSDLARGSLMLRMLRVGRAVAFGTRAGSIVVRQARDADPTVHGTTPTVTVVRGEDNLHPLGSDWDSFLAWARKPAPAWFHVSNLDRDRFYELARTAMVPEQEITGIFDEYGHAKLREGHHHATLILQMPTVTEVGFPEVRRDRLLAVVTKEGILTATTGSFDLQTEVEHLSQRAPLPPFAFPARIACALLALARDRNRFIAYRFDEEARRLETLEGGGEFLRETFRLRQEISTAALDVWHLMGIARALANGKTKLRGIDLKEEKYLDDLLAEMESLHETVRKSKEEIQTLIELHINFKSFETNMFLKLLAIVTFLGLIPSVAGGLLGMNLAGNPWPVTLGQVAFGVAMAMATTLYVFAIKGWLK